MPRHGLSFLITAALLSSGLAATAAQAAPPVFEPTVGFTTTDHAVAAFGDMNGDGRADVVTADDIRVTVQLAQPDGTYAAIGPIRTSGYGAERIELVDLDSDGRRDILGDGYGVYTGLIANDDGGYTPWANAHSGWTVATLDINHDGRLDLVTDASGLREGLSVRLAQADGSYVTSNLPMDETVTAVTTGDLNDDGWTDLVVNDYGDELWVLDGTATGLAAPRFLERDVNTATMVVADLGADDRDDVAYIDYWTGEIRVLYSLPDSTLSIEARYAMPSRGERLIAGDFNGDGLQDLATLTTALTILPGALGGAFGPPETVSLGQDERSGDLAAGDIDGDGRPDLAVTESHWPDWTLRVERNRTSFVTLSPPAQTTGHIDVPYVLSAFAPLVGGLAIEVKRRDTAEWSSRSIYAPAGFGTFRFDAWPEDGDADYRIRAVVRGQDYHRVLETTPEQVIKVRLAVATPISTATPTATPTATALPTVAPTPEPTATAIPQTLRRSVATAKAALAFRSRVGRKTTRVTRLRLEHVPTGSTVTVSCPTGCTAKASTLRDVSGTVSLARFATRSLKAGTMIRISLASPGVPARTVTIKILAGRAPRVSGSL
jgi:hypothetical protein